MKSDRELWRKEKERKNEVTGMREKKDKKEKKEGGNEKERKIRRFEKILDFISFSGFVRELWFINSRVIFSSKIYFEFCKWFINRELIKIVSICIISWNLCVMHMNYIWTYEITKIPLSSGSSATLFLTTMSPRNISFRHPPPTKEYSPHTFKTQKNHPYAALFNLSLEHLNPCIKFIV